MSCNDVTLAATLCNPPSYAALALSEIDEAIAAREKPNGGPRLARDEMNNRSTDDLNEALLHRFNGCAAMNMRRG